MPRNAHSGLSESIILFAMAQKITYCLVTSKYDDDAESFVETWHKDKLYSIHDENPEVAKADLKSLAVDALNYLVKGHELKLRTYIDRDSLSISASDLGIS
jgi:hypothetical protein